MEVTVDDQTEGAGGEIDFARVEPGTDPAQFATDLSAVFTGKPFPAYFLDVKGIVDRGTGVCVDAIAQVIAADTGADPERALLLASGLTGLAETSARWWLPRKGTVSRDEAVGLMSALAWRGISGFPRVDGDPLPH